VIIGEKAELRPPGVTLQITRELQTEDFRLPRRRYSMRLAEWVWRILYVVYLIIVQDYQYKHTFIGCTCGANLADCPSSSYDETKSP
jgi:hypothetical protein